MPIFCFFLILFIFKTEIIFFSLIFIKSKELLHSFLFVVFIRLSSFVASMSNAAKCHIPSKHDSNFHEQKLIDNGLKL